jgi:hypothetical protein
VEDARLSGTASGTEETHWEQRRWFSGKCGRGCKVPSSLERCRSQSLKDRSCFYCCGARFPIFRYLLSESCVSVCNVCVCVSWFSIVAIFVTVPSSQSIYRCRRFRFDFHPAGRGPDQVVGAASRMHCTDTSCSLKSFTFIYGIVLYFMRHFYISSQLIISILIITWSNG